MLNRLKSIFPQFIDSVLNSYTQVFFSNNTVFAFILLAVSFIDLNAGISGLLAVIISNFVAYLMGFNQFNIKAGYYGFNTLLVGLGLGIYYQFNFEFLLILLFASILTLFITIMLEGIIGKYGLPYLSISFLFGIWMVTLASREFTALEISERGIFVTNELYGIGGPALVDIYNWFSNLNLHESIILYFKSLGAIFFQYHVFAGIVIAIGLLIYSRISFLLSLLGFFSAYLFYQFVGGNLYELSYSYIGFNFILTSIAIGGFFIIPSKHSFLWVILLTPLISITITSSMAIMNLFQLSIFSLPFNLIVIMFLYILKFRERFFLKPEIVVQQQFSPEKNLYSTLNNKERFLNFKYLPISLPFWGKWEVTQGHNGEITHQDSWAHALDFEITDEEGNSFKDLGIVKEDYFCYNKPLISPYDGWVEEIMDGIDDNEIGDINLDQNWGNTIVIKHSDSLFSKISHIKKESFKVKKGDFVKKGDIIAKCGNTGRSPQPHVHFQLQSTPFIGSETLDYPIGHYIETKDQKFELRSYSIPAKGDIISNIEKNQNLYHAFHFVPGQKLKFEYVNPENANTDFEVWEVHTDLYKNTYLHCTKTNSKAWFKNDGSIHYFTHFEGNKNTLLYYFYLAAYKVICGYYKNLRITDTYPIHILNNRGLMFLQDFVAPFYIFMKSEYTIDYIKMEDNLSDSIISLHSEAIFRRGISTKRKLNFELTIESNRISRFEIQDRNKMIQVRESQI
jgi:urea transporter